jgi:hypothetical protein
MQIKLVKVRSHEPTSCRYTGRWEFPRGQISSCDICKNLLAVTVFCPCDRSHDLTERYKAIKSINGLVVL